MAIGNQYNWRKTNQVALRSDIRNEFGGPSSRVRLGNYYLGGRYIPSTGKWAPMAANVDINGSIRRFGTQAFSFYRGATAYRETLATVNGTSQHASLAYNYGQYAVWGAAEGPHQHVNRWETYYSYPQFFNNFNQGTSVGTFKLLTVARLLDWPNFIRSNMRTPAATVATRGFYRGIKGGYYATQTRSAGISMWFAKSRSRAYQSFGGFYQWGQRNNFKAGDNWIPMWAIWAGAFSSQGQYTTGTIRPRGGTDSYQTGGSGSGGKGGVKGSNATPPGGYVPGGRTPADQNQYWNIQNYYRAGYRHLQVMHGMQVNVIRADGNTSNALVVPRITVQVTT